MSGVQINVQAVYEKNTMQVEVAEVPIGRGPEKLFFTKVAMKCCAGYSKYRAYLPHTL